MRNDERFEIERALDLLPHVVGASWAMTYFRLKKIKNPTKQEFREKTIEYLIKIEPLMESFSNDKVFSDIQEYIEKRIIILASIFADFVFICFSNMSNFLKK